MREIKFRAWFSHGKTKEMLYDQMPGDCLVWKNQGQAIEQIMQYTGLKDKNGREIYERDVVKYKRIFFTDCSRTEIEREGEEIVGEFYYIDDIIPALRTSSEGHFRVFDSSFPKLELFDCEQDFEIIGNIFENPELLEGK